MRRPAGLPTGCTLVCLLLACALALPMLLPVPAAGHLPQDEVLQQVGVDEQLGVALPTDLPFRDQAGNPAQLGDYLGNKPAVLVMTYYGCPTLCPVLFRNLAGTLDRLGDLVLGRDFNIVTVSLNPSESLELAREKSATTYRMLARKENPERSWPFLSGQQDSIARLSRAVGIRYTRLPGGDYAHPNVLMLVTPQGRISRYLYGLEQRPQDLRLALIEASGGRIGTSTLVNRALLYCFHYDPVGKKYVLFASRLMTVTMFGVLLVTLWMLWVLWKRESKRPPA